MSEPKLNLYNVTVLGEGRFVLAESFAAAVEMAEDDAHEEGGALDWEECVESCALLCEAEDIIGYAP